jgi:DNA modification methylase
VRLLPVPETVLGVILRADARAIPLRDESVQCCITSPPYWGLRNYGNAAQLGLEKTPEEYVANMVAVFREVRRVLKNDGVLWLNLGDTYAGDRGAVARGKHCGKNIAAAQLQQPNRCMTVSRRRDNEPCPRSDVQVAGLKPKDMVGIPWRVAFALQADGWYLRSDIIWSKPNPMPESIKDRPTKAHEYIFLLTKSERYFYNADAIREPATDTGRVNGRDGRDEDERARPPGSRARALKRLDWTERGRNRRDVWTLSIANFSGAHFATFPEEIPRLCILAGSRPGDVVLDPFGGSGTTAKVALELGRKPVHLDLTYHDLAKKRMTTTPAMAGLMI